MKLKIHKKQILSLLILFTISLSFAGSLIINPIKTQAAPIISSETLGTACYERGDCGLNDFIRIIEASYTTVFGFIGSIALLMFMVGGVMFLVSAGNQEKVGKAKKLMISAIIGLLIIFASYLIVQFVLDTIGYQNAANWNRAP
ncbi:pilin [Patescibacteria group bacterium]|nr:pilin [Patescibacteria group bacterium]